MEAAGNAQRICDKHDHNGLAFGNTKRAGQPESVIEFNLAVTCGQHSLGAAMCKDVNQSFQAAYLMDEKQNLLPLLRSVARCQPQCTISDSI